jgi:hypothetical protein
LSKETHKKEKVCELSFSELSIISFCFKLEKKKKNIHDEHDGSSSLIFIHPLFGRNVSFQRLEDKRRSALCFDACMAIVITQNKKEVGL